MKRGILLFVAIFLTLGLLNTPVLSQLLNENFDYPIGTDLTSVGWLRYDGDPMYPIMVDFPGLEYPGYINSGIGNSALVLGRTTYSREDVLRHFEPQTNGSVYAFFMVNVHDDTGAGDRFFQIGPDTAKYVFFGRVFVNDSSGFIAFGLSLQNPSYVTYTPHIYHRDRTYLLALKYTFNEGSSNDDVASLWINPSLGGEEPPPNITKSSPYVADASNIGVVALRQSRSYYDILVDGIRIQTSWLRPEFSIDPVNIAFNDLYVGSVFQDTLTVTNTGTEPLEISLVESDNPAFIVYPTAGYIEPSASQEFYVVFGPTGPGAENGDLTFTHNGMSSPDVVTVSGLGLAPLFSAMPVSLNFGDLYLGSTFQDTVIVTNGGNVNLSISSVISDNPNFSVSPTDAVIAPAASSEFYIQFSPSSVGVKTGNIIFINNAPSFQDTVGVSGRGITPVFSVVPVSLNFGSLYIGDVYSDTVTVTNGGNTTLLVTSVVPTNSDFSVNPTSASLAPSSSRIFVITFAPSSAGLKIADIIFNHNGLTAPDTVAVSGTGVEYISIADARAKPNGEVVIIQGIITRAVGRTARIQDATGGLSLHQTTGAFYDSLQSGGIRPGDIVRIRGELSEVGYLKQFDQAGIISFERISRDNPLPAPQEITLAELAVNGEDYESELVTILNLTIDPDGDLNFAGGKLYDIEDASDTSNAVGLQIPNAVDTDIDGLPIPAVPFSFTGVVGQFSMSDPAVGYHLLAVLANDVMPLVDVKQNEPLPTEFALRGNYPNPFNPSTKIGFDIPNATVVNLVVYNAIGQKVAHILNNEPYQPGRYEVTFNAEQLASGIYFYRIVTPEFSSVRKMLLTK